MTIEDLLEEIVGEIRDEYDVESEPIVDEGNGRFVFSGKVDIDEVVAAAERADRARRVRDRRRLSAVAYRPRAGGRRAVRHRRAERRGARRRAAADQQGADRRRPPTAEDSEDAEEQYPGVMKVGFVSLIGRPNAGKSTLLNRLVGTKLAIVSDKPQTTRTRILGVKNYPDAQVVFLDTPGIHRPLHRMNVRMVDTAVDTIREVDVLGLVVDVSEPPGKGDQFVLDLVKNVEAPVFLILNKIDLIRKSKLLPIIDAVSASWGLCRDHSGVGGDRRQRRPARARDHRPAAGRGAALSAPTT